MKNIKFFLLTATLIALSNISFTQAINWGRYEPMQRHVINFHTGFDNAYTFGIGYGYRFNTKMPLILNIDFSVPAGDEPFDDLKTKIGGQLNVLHTGGFYTTLNAYGIIRRYENDFSRMLNFGSEFSLTAGYYRSKWHAAAELGFDKAIVTHIKHSRLYTEYNPGVKDGWYIPTAGNFFYGLQGGVSFGTNDLYAKFGKTLAQDFKTEPTVPFYLQLGWNLKMGR